jgi:hypothetical protein
MTTEQLCTVPAVVDHGLSSGLWSEATFDALLTRVEADGTGVDITDSTKLERYFRVHVHHPTRIHTKLSQALARQHAYRNAARDTITLTCALSSVPTEIEPLMTDYLLATLANEKLLQLTLTYECPR